MNIPDSSGYRHHRPATTLPVFLVRDMSEEDLDTVMDIEQRAYEFPWTEGIFRDCLRVGYVCELLASAEGAVLGYGVMSVAAGECHLLNLCINPAYQRRGLGRWLLNHFIQQARARGANVALLEVRVSNRAAYRLYQGLGFDEIGMRKDYYPARKGREDALILAREL